MLEGSGVGARRYHHEGHAQGEAEDDWPGQVGLIHYAAVRWLKGVQHRQGLLPDVVWIDAQFCREHPPALA